MTQHGIVATSQPLAAEAGLQILKRGGNAIDAAVATAAVLNLVEPMNVGMAGDLFAIIYIASENQIHVLNASGKAPTGATLQYYNSLGYHWNPSDWSFGSGMPGGILSVTVPGAAWGWDEVIRRYGTMTLNDVLQPAIHYAENGFPVSERISRDWNIPNAIPYTDCYPRCREQDPDSVRTWLIDRQKPAPGQLFRNPDLARSFRLLAQHGRNVFYTGEIARAIVAKSTALHGTMTMNDLANYRGEWVEPAHTNYHGFDVYELPPPSQAWNALEILNILQACIPSWVPSETLASLGPTDPQYWHLVAEAKKLAYWDLYHYNADPNFRKVPLDRLTSLDYAASLCDLVNPQQAGCPDINGYHQCPLSGTPAKVSGEGDTIVLSTADRWGNMVSWVNSNYGGFGSGITVPGYGFILHNRGQQFTLDPNSPNVIEPHKRPYNTLSAGFVMQNGQPVMTLGLMGGDMQAQGHAQVLVNIIDLGANLQAATDMARFHHSEVPNTLELESQLYNLVHVQLEKWGHTVRRINGSGVGGYQAIMFTPYPKGSKVSGASEDGDPRVNGFYRAGSDHRKDGQAAGW
jgi:gamma-glutamyltranspeptidase/glutathione hydrolase